MIATLSQIDEGRMAELLGNWMESRGALYRRLASALERVVVRGELSARTRLPPERQLARALAVSRSTVVAAYDLLRQEGWLVSRQGSGSYIARARSPLGIAGDHPHLLSIGRNPVFRGLMAPPADQIDFSVAAPFPAPAVREALCSPWSEDELALIDGTGYAPAGIEPLRRAVADRFAATGLPTTAEQIIITAGGQQALVLLCTLFLQPGDTVLIENPTFPGALEALRAAGAHLHSLCVDGAGIQPDAMEDLLARTSPRLVYVTPSFNNPTGAVLGRQRRRRLAEIARRYQVPVIEDGVLAELSFTGETPPAVATFDLESPIVTVGSASKTFWGGLRIGWIRSPEPIIDKLQRLKAVADLGNPVLSQQIVARLLPHIDAIRGERRAELTERLQRLTSALSELLPTWEWTAPTGGLSLWVKLPVGRATDFARLASRFGVTVVPGPVFSSDESFPQHLRLPFVLAPEALEEGVRRLADAWQAYAPRAQSRALPQAAVV